MMNEEEYNKDNEKGCAYASVRGAGMLGIADRGLGRILFDILRLGRDSLERGPYD